MATDEMSKIPRNVNKIMALDDRTGKTVASEVQNSHLTLANLPWSDLMGKRR